MPRAVIYAHIVSETDRQVAELQSYAERSGFDVVRVFMDDTSANVPNQSILSECLNWCCAGNSDVLLLSSISNLGLHIKDIIDNTDLLTRNKINIHFLDIDADTLLPTGEKNTYTAKLIAMIQQGIQMERNQVAVRLKEGRIKAQKAGVKMGRKTGTYKTKKQKTKEYAEAIRLLRQGSSIRKTAALCRISTKTVQMLKKEFITDNQNRQIINNKTKIIY